MTLADGASAPGDPSPAYGGPDEVVFVRDLASGHVTWSPAIEEVFGYSPAGVAPTLAWLRERVHPDDADRVLEGIRAADDAGRPVALEYRFRRADGSYARVVGQGYVLCDAGGAPALAIGSIRDVSLAGPAADELGRMSALAGDAFLGVDADGVIRLANERAAALFGYPRGQLIGMPVEALVPKRSSARHAAHRARYRTHPTTRPMGTGIDLAARRRDGAVIPVDITLRPIQTLHGPLTIAAVRDLSAHRRSDEELRRLMEYVRLLRAVAAAANEAASPDVAFRAAVDEVCTVMRFPVGHVFVPTADGTRLVSTDIWHLADSARYQELVDATAAIAFAAGDGLPGRALAERRPVFIPDIAGVSVPRRAAALHAGLRAAFGCPVLLGEEVVAVLEFFSPEALMADAELLGVMADVGKQLGRVIERDRAHRVTTHLALHDALTDLPNRHLLDDRLGQAIVHARRDEGSVALLFIDLDDFKSINDTFGHPAGDAVLREVASRLRTGLREQDTVARLGGDEFAVVLPETGRDGAVEAAKKMRHALEPPLLVEGQPCQVGATVGIALFPLHAADASELLRRADMALYEAKRAGIGFATYDPGTVAGRPARVTRRRGRASPKGPR